MYQSQFDFLRLSESFSRYLPVSQQIKRLKHNQLSQALIQLKQNISQRKDIPNIFCQVHDNILVRYLNSSELDTNRALESYIAHVRWIINNPTIYQITEEVEAIFKAGTMYISGRDKQFRPTLVIKTWQLDQEEHSSYIIEKAVSILLTIMNDYMLKENVESWVVIIDTEEQSLQQFSIEVLILQLYSKRKQPQSFRIFKIIFLVRLKPFIFSTLPYLSSSLGNICQTSLENKRRRKSTFQNTMTLVTQLAIKYGGQLMDYQYWPPNPQQFLRYHKEEDKPKQSIIIQASKQSEQEEPFDQHHIKKFICKQCCPIDNEQRESVQSEVKLSFSPLMDSYISYQRKYDSYMDRTQINMKPYLDALEYQIYEVEEEPSIDQIKIQLPSPNIFQSKLINNNKNDNMNMNMNINIHNHKNIHDCEECQKREVLIKQMINPEYLLQIEQEMNQYKTMNNPFFEDNMYQDNESLDVKSREICYPNTKQEYFVQNQQSNFIKHPYNSIYQLEQQDEQYQQPIQYFENQEIKQQHKEISQIVESIDHQNILLYSEYSQTPLKEDIIPQRLENSCQSLEIILNQQFNESNDIYTENRNQIFQNIEPTSIQPTISKNNQRVESIKSKKSIGCQNEPNIGMTNLIIAQTKQNNLVVTNIEPIVIKPFKNYVSQSEQYEASCISQPLSVKSLQNQKQSQKHNNPSSNDPIINPQNLSQNQIHDQSHKPILETNFQNKQQDDRGFEVIPIQVSSSIKKNHSISDPPIRQTRDIRDLDNVACILF